MYKLDKSMNAVYSLNYHFITCIKYRKKIFIEEEIVSKLKQKVEEISEEYGVEIIEQECGEDHIHILFRTKPNIEFKSYIQALKGRTARYLRKEFPEKLKDEIWGEHFWSPSYFLATTGNVTLDILSEYVKNQREEIKEG